MFKLNNCTQFHSCKPQITCTETSCDNGFFTCPIPYSDVLHMFHKRSYYLVQVEFHECFYMHYSRGHQITALEVQGLLVSHLPFTSESGVKTVWSINRMNYSANYLPGVEYIWI